VRRMTFSEWDETFGPYEEHTHCPISTPLDKIWSFVQGEWEEEYETDKFIIPGTLPYALAYYTTKHAYTYTDQEVAVTNN